MATRLATLVGLLLALTLAAMAVLAWSSTGGGNAISEQASEVVGARPPEPTSLQDLVAQSDVVVVGKVEGFLDLFTERPPVDLAEEPPVPGVDRSVPYSNFRVQVSDYLVGEGPGEIVLTQLGDVTGERPAYTGLPQLPEDELVVLFLQSIGDRSGHPAAYVAVLGWWGQLVEDDGRVEYVDGQRVSFLPDADLNAVIDQVRRQ